MQHDTGSAVASFGIICALLLLDIDNAAGFALQHVLELTLLSGH
jgi:hypothetical protein